MAEVESELQRMYAEALQMELPSEAVISTLANDVLKEDLYLCGFSQSDTNPHTESTRKHQRVRLSPRDAQTDLSTGPKPGE